jgi:hypothetical protein
MQGFMRDGQLLEVQEIDKMYVGFSVSLTFSEAIVSCYHLVATSRRSSFKEDMTLSVL